MGADLKVLLIAPTYKYRNPKIELLSFSDFPSGIAYVAGALKQAGHEVIGLNPNNQIQFEKPYYMLTNLLNTYLAEHKPDLIGLGGLCIDYQFFRDAIDLTRRFSPKTPIVLGGGIINNDREFIFEHLKPDYGIVGEAEDTVVKLANKVPNAEIENLSWWADGKPVHNKLNHNYRPIDERPYPDYDVFGCGEMIENLSGATRLLYRSSRLYPKVYSVLTARHCPFSCVPKGTLVLMADMRQIPIETVKKGDKIIGVRRDSRWRYALGTVEETFSRKEMVYGIETTHGTVYSTREHPWLMHDGWLNIDQVMNSLKNRGRVDSTRHALRKVCDVTKTTEATHDYKWGYLAGAAEGDGCFWTRHGTNGKSSKVYHYRQFRIVGDYEMLDRYLLYGQELGVPLKKQRFNGGSMYKCNRSISLQSHVEVVKFQNRLTAYDDEVPEFIRGWLAGIYDAEGSCSGGSLRISQNEGPTKRKILRLWQEAGFRVINEPRALRLVGGRQEKVRFLSWIHPAVTHKANILIDKQVYGSAPIKRIYEVGEQEVYNLQTDIESFIADGFVTHNCSFCVHRSGIPYRARSMASVMEEIRIAWEKYHFNVLLILDELFAANKHRMNDFSNGVLEGKEKYGWDFDWTFQTHASASLDEDSLRLAKKAGLYYFSYGIESGSQTVLDSMGKKIKISQVEEGIKLAEKVGVGFGGNLIFGDIAETQTTIRESLDFFGKYGSNSFIFLATLNPYPGNKLFDTCVERGLIGNKAEYYSNIDNGIYNMTKMPNGEWFSWVNFLSTLEPLWLWVKGTEATNVTKQEEKDIFTTRRNADYWLIEAICPHCQETIQYREGITRGRFDGPIFMGTGCTKCGKRIKIDLSLLRDKIESK